MNATKSELNGRYILYPEGGAWLAAEFRDGILVGITEEANAATHDAANDSWSGIESADEVGPDESAQVIQAALGNDVLAEMVIVTRARRHDSAQRSR